MVIRRYRACDLCKKEMGSGADVKIKYKAKRKWWAYPCDEGWERIDICADCLEKIIKVVKEGESE